MGKDKDIFTTKEEMELITLITDEEVAYEELYKKLDSSLNISRDEDERGEYIFKIDNDNSNRAYFCDSSKNQYTVYRGSCISIKMSRIDKDKNGDPIEVGKYYKGGITIGEKQTIKNELITPLYIDREKQLEPQNDKQVDDWFKAHGNCDGNRQDEKPDIIPSFEEVRRKLEKDGRDYPDYEVAAFYMAFKTNQLIILHGKPGTGKTSFTKRIAEAMGAEYRVISVRPNWVDNQDLMGFFNPVEMVYYPTQFLDIITEAIEHKEKNYIVCLDEMNLSYAEQYFSDVLSAMEMEGEKKISLYSENDQKRRDEYVKALKEVVVDEKGETIDERIKIAEMKSKLVMLKDNQRYPATLVLPDNVQIVGTLNMDATTKELSPKVIDRSFLIDVDVMGERKVDDSKICSELNVDNFEFLKAINEEFSSELSKRNENQIKGMLKRAADIKIDEVSLEDIIILGKVLPKISVEKVYNKEDKQAEEELPNIYSLLGNEDFKPFKSSRAKLQKMFHSELGNPEVGSLNYWQM